MKNNWRTCTLGDVVEVKYGKAHKALNDGNYPCFGSGGFMRSVDSFLHDDESILIPRKGSLNNIMYSDKPFWTVDTMFWTKINKEKANPKFLFYQLVHIDYTILNVGSAVPSLTVPVINEIEIQLPPLPEQRAIGEVLSSLDDKIDLLHRQNKTLEKMAETLFRHHFIDNAQDDWEEVPLSFFGEIICGKTPPKKRHEYFGGVIPFIKIPDMHGKTFVNTTTDTLTEEGKNSQLNKTLPPQSICVSCIATVGLVSMNIVESQTNQQINSIIPRKDIYRYFIYLLMKNSTDLLLAMASGGTATLNLNTGNFSTISVQCPKEELLESFHEEVKPMFEKILSNTKQIQTLEKIRDTLLPKLISGDVRVEYKEVV